MGMCNYQDKKIPFGKRSGLEVCPVSIGAMRLPEDDQQAVELLRQAIDANMIYIDTSRGYGDSEIKLGKALKDGYREKVILSTKWAPWVKKYEPDDDASAECTYKRICESMERLDVDYLDFYQIWNIHSEECFKLVTQKGGMLDGIRRAMDEGLVRHTGFTTHDTPENISKYIDQADWCEVIPITHYIQSYCQSRKSFIGIFSTFSRNFREGLPFFSLLAHVSSLISSNPLPSSNTAFILTINPAGPAIVLTASTAIEFCSTIRYLLISILCGRRHESGAGSLRPTFLPLI